RPTWIFRRAPSPPRAGCSRPPWKGWASPSGPCTGRSRSRGRSPIWPAPGRSAAPTWRRRSPIGSGSGSATKRRSPEGFFPSTVSRRDLLLRDLVPEVVRIEAVEAAVRGFRLRIHEEGERGAFRPGENDVVREVVGHPVHLPGAEEPRPGLLHHLVGERAIPGRLLEHDFPHVRRIDRNPAEAAEVDLRAAVLRLRHVLRRRPETLVAQLRPGDPDSVHVHLRKPR